MQVQGPFSLVKVREKQQDKTYQKRIKMWDFDEIVRYTVFLNQYLKNNRQNSITKLQRNDYIWMSKLIKSRNANQCRIFHAKLLKIGKSIQEVFLLLSSQIDQYGLIYQKFKEAQKTKAISGEVDKIEEGSAEEDKNKPDKPALSKQQPLICQDNCCHGNMSLLDLNILTKEDWYQQLDDFIAGLNNSWLDDI